MPLPFLILLGGGAVAAAARGAAWLAEQRVDQINSVMLEVEGRARQVNEAYRDKRQYWKLEYERRLSALSGAYEALLSSNGWTASDLADCSPEPCLLERMGDLSVGRPLLIAPNFNPPESQHQLAGFRAYAQGRSISQTNPRMGGAMQNLGMIAAAGSYVTQQTDIIGDANKYVASAKVHIETLRRAIDGFDKAFAAEVERDLRNAQRAESVLNELLWETPNRDDARSTGAVLQIVVGYLGELVEKYA